MTDNFTDSNIEENGGQKPDNRSQKAESPMVKLTQRTDNMPLTPKP